ncbi:MAG: hypothetical protein KKD99_11180, partial [Proteobacteria bacterium]|nr:hypothetical protein [Pseudomonadota bacterium]
RGDGGELGLPGERGKMQALHSSSALVCNVFEYWRDRDKSVLAAGLGLPVGIVRIEFERKFPTGLPGNPPHLDIVLTLANGSILAVESKLLEPYGGRRTQGFKRKYFASDPGLWARFGYLHCQELASRLDSGEVVFRWFYAAQMLKHILGLAASGFPWELLYLWYEAPGPGASEHATEAAEFARVATADEIVFRSISYQKLFAVIRRLAGKSESAYLAYLDGRYFGQLGRISPLAPQHSA